MKYIWIILLMFGSYSCSSEMTSAINDRVTNDSKKSSQNLEERSDFCGREYKDLLSLIGDSLKIYHTGGVYSTINESDKYEWPTEEIRQKSGMSGWGDYRPKNGDTGELIHVFESINSHNRYLMLLKIENVYVPIGCRYVVGVNEMDIEEESDKISILDSIKNREYANGCIFKADERNGGCWARQNGANIDVAAENFSCSLMNNGVDTILLAKYLSGNGVSKLEHACIFWVKNGDYYFKRIDVNKHLEAVPSAQIKVAKSDVFNFYFKNKIDTVTTDPNCELYISHEHGYLVQMYTAQSFFCQKLTGTHLSGDPAHIKSRWWSLIMAEIKDNSVE